MYRQASQKIRKDTEHLNNTIKKLDLFDIYKTATFKKKCVHGTFTRVDQDWVKNKSQYT